jgi:hypothetical protein
MGNTTATETSSAMLDFTALLLGTLGFIDCECVSLGYEDAGGVFHTAVLAPTDAPAVAATIPATANAYFGVNPTRGPARINSGRGIEVDVTRLAALWADLDVKLGGCPSLDVVHAIVGDLSGIVGTRPSVTVDSGHGLHAYWEICDGRVHGGDVGAARALVKRWGRLVAVVAEKRGAAVDNVFDLARMLRIPGTLNNKSRANGAAPLPVTGHPDTGGPLAVAEVDERLTEVGVLEEPGDREAGGAPICGPAAWESAAQTCEYVAAMLANLPVDGPPPPEKAKKGRGRHQWAASQAVKLTCARRLGCITQTDWDSARTLLNKRLTELRSATGESVPRHEVGGLFKLGLERTAAKTEEQARAELGNHIHDTAGPIEFEDPIALVGNLVEVPPFPVDALPTVFARKIAELAEATQTDPAMAATSALSVLSACAGGHASIQIRHGWREPLCLYTATIAAPGERKSAVQASMVRPLHDAEADLGMAGELTRLQQQDALELAKKKVDLLNKDAVNAAAAAARPGATDNDKKDAEQAAQAARDAKTAMREIKVPVVPRLLADDITPEAAATLLADHGGRIAIISAEGGIFDTLAGRYARTVNIDVFLKGHSGDPIRVDRQGRAPQHIPSPALTLGLMVQPRIIETIAANRDFVGRGLLARFLYAQPVSKVGSRTIGAKPVDSLTDLDYGSAVKNLAGDMAGWVGDPAVLMLDPFAEVTVRRIEEAVEPTLACDGELASPSTLTEWGSKYVGAVVRIAGLLHLAEHGEAGHSTPIEAATIRAAERIGGYFKATAINVFTRMADPDVVDAVYLLGRVGSLDVDEVSERDVFTASSRLRFPTVAAMKPALDRLVEHGYLIPQEQTKKSGGGRPPSPRYKVHPTSAKAAQHAKGWSR